MDNFGDADWSGSGWSSKEILNEISSVPEAKPPPKYSTTRAKPVNYNNVNNNAEADFHFNNNIENTDHTSVQVDDFYYDYNFINFHEDLSDDFEGDGNESGDRFNAPQENKPSHSIKENAFMETTRTPTATSATFTVSKGPANTLKTVETQNTNMDSVKGSGNTATKESMQTKSEIVDDFLSEDYLLPVSTTHSPLLSTTLHSRSLKERHDTWLWPESFSAMPRLVFTTKEPTSDVELEQYREEADDSDSLSGEEDVRATSKHASPTPQHQATVDTAVSKTVSELDEHDEYEYSYNEQSAQGSDISADREAGESPEPSGSPMPETVIHKTEGKLDRSASEIPQTTSQSAILSTALKLGDSDLDQTYDNILYANSKSNSWDTDLDLSTTSLPPPLSSEKSTPFPISFLKSSGNQESSDSTLLTGTEIIPPTKLEGATQASPADFLLSTTLQQIPTRPVFTQRTRTDSTSQVALFDGADFAYYEAAIPPISSSTSNPVPSYQHSANSATTPQYSSIPLKHMESPPSTVTILPTHPPAPLPVPTFVLSSPSTQVSTTAYWVTGNWSAVSLCSSTYSVVLTCF